jgi:hypothetical protein
MRHASDSGGFGLIETIIALTLTSIVIIGIFSAFNNSQRTTSHVTQAIEHRQNTRTALQLIEHDVRMAGSGWGRIAVQGAYGGAPLAVQGITPGFGGALTRSDTIGIMGAWDVVTTLRSGMSSPTSTIRVQTAAGFAVNDFCVVTNGTTAHLFQVTGISGFSNNDINHANTSTYNAAGGHQQWPVGGYLTGASVYRVSWVSFKVDTTSKRRQLVRWQAGWPTQVVAYDVTRFVVNYRLTGDSLTRDPDDMSLVERIEPVLHTVVTTAKKPPLPDSAWASIIPRSY